MLAELALYLKAQFEPILPREAVRAPTSQASTPRTRETIVTPTGEKVAFRPAQPDIPNTVNMTASVEQVSSFIGPTEARYNDRGDQIIVGLVETFADNTTEVAATFKPYGATEAQLPHPLSHTNGVDESDPRIVYANDRTLAVIAVSEDNPNINSPRHLRLMVANVDPNGVEIASSEPIHSTNGALRILKLETVSDCFGRTLELIQRILFETDDGQVYYVNIYNIDGKVTTSLPYYIMNQTRALFPRILYNSQ